MGKYAFEDFWVMGLAIWTFEGAKRRTTSRYAQRALCEYSCIDLHERQQHFYIACFTFLLINGSANKRLSSNRIIHHICVYTNCTSLVHLHYLTNIYWKCGTKSPHLTTMVYYEFISRLVDSSNYLLLFSFAKNTLTHDILRIYFRVYVCTRTFESHEEFNIWQCGWVRAFVGCVSVTKTCPDSGFEKMNIKTWKHILETCAIYKFDRRIFFFKLVFWTFQDIVNKSF